MMLLQLACIVGACLLVREGIGRAEYALWGHRLQHRLLDGILALSHFGAAAAVFASLPR